MFAKSKTAENVPEKREFQRRHQLDRRDAVRFGAEERRSFQDRRSLNTGSWDTVNPF